MWLFDQLKWTIIENPLKLHNRVKIEREKQKKKEAEGLIEEEREEWRKYHDKLYYQRHKQRILIELEAKRRKEEEEAIQGFMDYHIPTHPPYVSHNALDMEYLNRYRDDFYNKRGRVMCQWWGTNIKYNIKNTWLWEAYTEPIRIVPRERNMEWSMSRIYNEKHKAYNAVKHLIPHINELEWVVSRNNIATQWLKYHMSDEIYHAAKEAWIDPATAIDVLTYLKYWRWNNTLTPIGYTCFIVGDRILCPTGMMFQISPKHWISWLNEENYDTIHKQANEALFSKWIRMSDYRKICGAVYGAYIIKQKMTSFIDIDKNGNEVEWHNIDDYAYYIVSKRTLFYKNKNKNTLIL